MTSEAEQLLEAALRLPRDDRSRLAELLRESVDAEDDGELTPEWRAEIARRVADLDSGRTRAVPWEDVRRKLWEGL